MTDNEKDALWVVAGIGAVVILALFLLRRRDTAPSPIAQSSPSSPPTFTLTYPGNQGWVAAPNGLPLAVVSPDNGCGCGCGGCENSTAQIAPGINSLLTYYTSQSRSVFDNYEKNIYSSIPDTVTQYFNNPVGYAASTSSQAIFRSA